MGDYRRFIAYIYEYDGKMKLGNKGFARIDVRNGCGRLFVSLKDMKKEEQPQGFYFYKWNQGIMQSVKMGELAFPTGVGELKLSFKSDNINGDTRFDEISGIVIGRGKDKLYGAEWDDRDINMALLDINGGKIEKIEPEILQEEEIESEEIEEQEVQFERTEQINQPLAQSASWKDIFNDENIMQPFDDDMMYDCVEATPDIVSKMPFGDKNYYNNSFLLHGYFNYGHILIGKLAKPGAGERYFVGIPGTYNNRERVIATMYGFENFRKSIRRDYRHPYFGYWYSVVDSD